MPGVLKLEGTNIATGDGNGAVTINNATLGSAVTVPASVGGTEVLLEKYTANDSVTNKIFDLATFSETFNQYKLVLNKLLVAFKLIIIECAVVILTILVVTKLEIVIFIQQIVFFYIHL